MAERLDGDELDWRVAAGAMGGKARTPEKLAAVRANIARARIMRDWYRRHPEQKPSRRQEEQDNG